MQDKNFHEAQQSENSYFVHNISGIVQIPSLRRAHIYTHYAVSLKVRMNLKYHSANIGIMHVHAFYFVFSCIHNSSQKCEHSP